MTQDVASLKREVERAEAQLSKIIHTMTNVQRKSQAKLAEVEADLKRVEAMPPSPRKDRVLHMHRLRRAGALVNQEMSSLFMRNLDTRNVAAWQREFQANHDLLEHLYLRARFIYFDYAIYNYRAVAEAIDALAGGQATPAPRGSGRLSGGTGSLSGADAGTGTSRLSGAKPGAAPTGTGRLSGTPAAPGAQPPAPRLGGTGRLSAPAQGPATATARLNANPGQQRPATGELQGGRPPVEAIVKGMWADATKRQALEQVRQIYREIETIIAPIRGDEPGQLALTGPQGDAVIKQVAGKVYYLNRALAALGDGADALAFETSGGSDSDFQVFMSSMSTPAPQPQADQSLSGMLKSLFGK